MPGTREIIDATPAIERIQREHLPNPEFHNLPRKFKSAISGHSRQDVTHEIQDVAFIGSVHPEHGPGFECYVGGGLSTNPMLAQSLGAWIPLDEVPDVWAGVARIFRDYGYRRMRTRARLKFLVKDSLAKGVTGPIIRAVGGVAVDRSRTSGMVDGIVAQLKELDEFQLVIAPEGTRKKKDYWKSGFWHIANQSGMPVTLAYIDSTRKVYGWREAIEISGDMKADMDYIRDVYKDMSGFNPAGNTWPRLRGEQDESLPGHPEQDPGTPLN